jgi:hypothetical protein
MTSYVVDSGRRLSPESAEFYLSSMLDPSGQFVRKSKLSSTPE